MLKIKDKTIYDKEVQKMISSYENTRTTVESLSDESKEALNSVESAVELIDNVVGAGMTCTHDELLSSRIHLVMSIMGAMLSSECDRYLKDVLESKKVDLDKTIDKMADELSDIILKAINELLED